MKILIVGTGLMGGSFALSLKEKNEDYEFGGLDANVSNGQEAIKKGIISTLFQSEQEAVEWADIIILTIPVLAIKESVIRFLDAMNNQQVLIDFGSTKQSICQVVADHPRRGRFVAAHPIAGTEYSGPQAAFSGLYAGKTLIICEKEKSSAEALELTEKLFTEIDMILVYMGAEGHDMHLAYISHLSHVLAYSLSNTVLEKEKDGELLLELAGSGFASTVRLAKSSPDMWAPIFLDNKKALLESVEAMMKKVNQLKEIIEKEDVSELKAFLTSGRKISKLL